MASYRGGGVTLQWEPPPGVQLEEALGELARIAGPVGAAAGCCAEAGMARAHGPVVPGINLGHTVSDQQDVDALLSGLGM